MTKLKKNETAKVCFSFQMSFTVLLISIALNKTELNQTTFRFLFLEFDFFLILSSQLEN